MRTPTHSEARKAAAASTQWGPAQAATSEACEEKVSILIVDDDPAKLLSLRIVLEELDLDIVCAKSGPDALRELLARSFAVILLDIHMPGMDGFDTAELIRQRRNCENTPIIFVTAYGDELFLEEGYRLGAVDFILTPIVPDVLRSKVNVFVKLCRQTREIHRQAERLQQRSSQLSALTDTLTRAEVGERRRLARFLHDEVQQLLVAAILRLERTQNDFPEAREQLEAVGEVVDESIAAIRSLTLQLSPPVLREGGLVKAFEWLAGRFQAVHEFDVTVEAGPDCPEPAEESREFLYEAVRELLFNAVKHAGVSSASVEIRHEAGQLLITVTDRGCGIDMEKLEAEAVQQEHFGLRSIRERLACSGGTMSVCARDGETRIELATPIGEQSQAVSVDDARSVDRPTTGFRSAPEGRPASAVKATGTIRVVLADDHDILRKGLLALLSEKSDVVVVGEAVDGEEAVRLAGELSPDVVVMDVTMPRLCGVEATRKIVQTMPEVQVIGLSMHEGDGTADEMLAAGAVSYLNKAGDPGQLLAAIRATRKA